MDSKETTTETTTETITETTSTSNLLPLSALQSSQPLQTFLSTHPYLRAHLPVLLSRLNLPSSSGTERSALAREQERQNRIIEVLKETMEVDPEVAALYDILSKEGFI
jgi:hypothetical protein